MTLVSKLTYRSVSELEFPGATKMLNALCVVGSDMDWKIWQLFAF